MKPMFIIYWLATTMLIAILPAPTLRKRAMVRNASRTQPFIGSWMTKSIGLTVVFSQILLLSESGICSEDALDKKSSEELAVCQVEEPTQTPDTRKYPWELLKEPQFRSAYFSALGYEPQKKHWLSLIGPGPRSKTIIVNDQVFLYTWSCKQHECDTHEIHLLFDARKATIFGLLVENTSISLLGNPSKCIQKAIEQQLIKK